MEQVVRPVKRSKLRLAVGRAAFSARRYWQWYFSGIAFARRRQADNLAHVHFSHRTPLLRALKNVDMRLQHNKVSSLAVAASCIDGVVLRPGEVFSFWRLVGRPRASRGFKPGLVLSNGSIGEGMGGGLCQMTNLIYWMTLHTPLTVSERWRHGFDVFPDDNRSQPFASGATCAYNYVDLQVSNSTPDTFQLRLWLDDSHLNGAWRASAEPLHRYEVFERDHAIRPEWWGGYSRHNSLWRRLTAVADGSERGEEFITENHAIMMYEPLLEGTRP
jgi:vancomycin resistance protein VanW